MAVTIVTAVAAAAAAVMDLGSNEVVEDGAFCYAFEAKKIHRNICQNRCDLIDVLFFDYLN